MVDALRGLAANALALFRTRLALLRVEAQEEADRLAGLLLWGVAAVLLGIVGLVFLAVFLTVLLWDSHRLLALGVFAALFLVTAGLAGWLAWQRARQGSQLFAASLAELQRDAAALDSSPRAP